MSESVLIEQVYPRLPVFLQNVACWYYGQKESRIRSGAAFERYLTKLLDSENWSASEIEAYQDEKLRGLIRHAYENVPYYRERWTALKLSPADIKSREDLPKLPILTKEDVRQNFKRLISRSTNTRRLVFRHTSGTTGKALHFYTTEDAIALQWAVWWRHRMRFGVQPGAWHANFTGRRVVPLDQHAPPFWRWNRPLHQALLTMHHLSADKISCIIEFLNSHRFDFYSGYPSIIHMLALRARTAGLRLQSPPRAVFTGAENMLEFQRREIWSFTGAVLSDQYGCSEGCGNASQCPEFVYHEDSEFGILESVDLRPGNPASSILCTGLACDSFPFIRYEVGDTGVSRDGQKGCHCGRKTRVWASIEGRTDDYVITPEGLHVMRFDYVFKDALNVEEAQVLQRNLGEVVLRIVRRPAYKVQDESVIAREIGRWISPTLKVRFEYVSEIERETNGKFRAVLSRLDADLNKESSRRHC